MGQSPPNALVNILPDVALLSSAGTNRCALLSQLGIVTQSTVWSSVQSDVQQKIKDWHFVNLHNLLFKSGKGREEENNFLQQCDGKMLLVQSMDHLKRRATDFPDIVA